MSRELEEFQPINEKEVTMYTCGPTVYDFAHIGNLRAYIFADILKRTLIYNNYKVKQVLNITDVGHLTSDNDEGEDKIEKSARLESKSANELAEYYSDSFKSDLQKLNIVDPEIWAKATDHIQEMIDLVQNLEDKGFTYKTSDGIYFDTSNVKDYGRLARLNLEGQEEGARVEVNSEKKNPTDFALWKFSPEGTERQMEWESPWGVGFPGWHIECSAMSMKYLGETLDIHTGGIDHLPVHHPNEIAQSEAVTGKKYVKYWLHNEFLLMNGGKMAKSDGGFITLAELEKRGIDPIVYRFFNLSSHYRSKLNFTWDALENSAHTWNKFKNKYFDLGQHVANVNTDLVDEFYSHVNNDLAMPQALAVLWKVFKSDIDDADKKATLIKFDEVLGLGLADLKEKTADLPDEIQAFVDEREKARKNNKWDKADELRDKIVAEGYEIEDTADSSRVVKK